MPSVFTRSAPLAAATLAAAIALASPGSARAEDIGARTFSVKYSDLDLTTRDGRAELERRVERAVKEVCAPADDKQLKLVLQSRACREATLASADVGLRQAIATATSNRAVGG